MEPLTTKHLKRLTTEEYYQAKEYLSRVVKYLPSTLSNGSISLVKQEDWFAVPMAINGGFFPKTLDGFVKAAESYGRSKVIGTWIAPVNPDSQTRAFSVPAILEGVQEFYLDVDFLLMNCFVFAGNPDWVYIWIVDDLDIVCGTEPITRLFTDMNVDQAFEAFSIWLNESPESRAIQEYFKKKGIENTLERVYHDLKQFNNTPRGTEVIIDWF
ncbi:hypothetical protein VB735_29720 [Halotia wernerae UHCC 0503]|nr:hypothetical protein [Halotia wernerae UHCC 0503]